MLLFPNIDPVAIRLGPVSVHWYGLMYLIGFMAFLYLGKYRAKRFPERGLSVEAIDDLLTYGVLGVVLGGRLGQVLFYEPGYYFAHPLEIFAIWRGGMSFHGGFLGVFIAMWLFAKRKGLPLFQLTDFVVPLVPIGLMTGRIGNFINGELWGRVADASLPWSMVFPHVDNLPRHPSQLYQAALEGLCLFVIMWVFTQRARPQRAASGLFLVGYGAFRFMAEYFREPDAGIFGHSYAISMGQWLSLPMIVAGAYLLIAAYQSKKATAQ